jgi:peptide/nickel transport system substrate-binding protein
MAMTIHRSTPALIELQTAYRNGRMSRREFLGRAAAMGFAASAAGFLSQSARAEEPKKGGNMRIGTPHGQSSDTLDPALLFNGGQWMIAYAVRDTLTQIGPSGGLDPALATEWEPSSDASQWVFTLRQGVEFHNGKTFTAEDVIASINHHLGEDSESGVKPIAERIASMKADGADKLIIDLVKPNVDFPYSLASANFTICPATADGGIDADSGMGTGGYVLQEWQPGVQAFLERYPNYWRDDRAFVNTAEVLTIPDATARMNALQSDDVDIVDQVDYKLAKFLNQADGIEVERTDGPLHYLFSLMSDRAPFESKDVRLAMKYAVDRQKLIDTILDGYAVVGNDQPIGPSYPYHDPDQEQRAYDPDKAKYHLKQAGLDKLEVQLHAGEAAFNGAVDAAVLFQEAAKASNIEIDVVREPADGYWSDVYMNKPAFANYWGGYSTASEMFTAGYLPGSPWNESVFESERFVSILDESNAELDPARRREMMSEMQRMVSDEAGQVIFAFPSNLLARNQNVGHGELASDRPMDGRLIITRWWMENASA